MKRSPLVVDVIKAAEQAGPDRSISPSTYRPEQAYESRLASPDTGLTLDSYAMSRGLDGR